MPMPRHIEPTKIFTSICPLKDVDGFHPLNVGKLNMHSRTSLFSQPEFIPCTPLAILRLLKESGIRLSGKVAIVIGRSNLVGIPIVSLLRQRDCTVIHAHSFTTTLPHLVAQADIVVAACGVPELIQGSWLKKGCVVIDVGINYVQENGQGRRRIVGDVCYESARRKASVITPVPGGVGPMTVTMLLQNVIDSFERRISSSYERRKVIETVVSE